MDKRNITLVERTLIAAPWIRHDGNVENIKPMIEFDDRVYSIIVNDIRPLESEDIQEILETIPGARIIKSFYNTRARTFHVLDT